MQHEDPEPAQFLIAASLDDVAMVCTMAMADTPNEHVEAVLTKAGFEVNRTTSAVVDGFRQGTDDRRLQARH